MTAPPSDPIIQQQIAYYRSRAPEYDEWFLRQGRYDQGAEINQRWFDEVALVRDALAVARPNGDILEFACGTGLWTERLVPAATTLTALDASPEMLALNRQRLQDDERVRYVLGDLFTWQSDRTYDFIFFGFWLSHVPPARFASFWQIVADVLAPGGRVFFVDSLRASTGSARDQAWGDETDVLQRRRLNDGSEFDIVKVYYPPAQLEASLTDLGWSMRVSATTNYFLHGFGQRADSSDAD